MNHVFPFERLIDTVKNLGDRLYTLHISDYDGIIERHQMPFDGIIDWSGFCSALEFVDYDGPFCMKPDSLRIACRRDEDDF